MLNSSLSGFSFRKNSEGEKEVSTDGGSTWENFSSGASAVLLWTNPNPHGAFKAQTINLDLSNYEYVIIQATSQYTDEESPFSQVLAKVAPTDNENFKMYNVCCSHFKTQTLSAYTGMPTRGFQVTRSGISFSTGCLNQVTHDYWAVPYKIYGIESIGGLD